MVELTEKEKMEFKKLWFEQYKGPFKPYHLLLESFHSKINIFKERRFGKFDINFDWIEQCPNVVMEFMAGMIILNADNKLYSKSITYTAAFELFPPVEEFMKAPYYHIFIGREPGEYISQLVFDFEA